MALACNFGNGTSLVLPVLLQDLDLDFLDQDLEEGWQILEGFQTQQPVPHLPNLRMMLVVYSATRLQVVVAGTHLIH